MTEEEENLPENEIIGLCNKKADAEFKASCVDLLDKIGKNIPYAKVSGSI